MEVLGLQGLAVLLILLASSKEGVTAKSCLLSTRTSQTDSYTAFRDEVNKQQSIGNSCGRGQGFGCVGMQRHTLSDVLTSAMLDHRQQQQQQED